MALAVALPPLALLLLDERAARFSGRWPEGLTAFAQTTTDLVTLLPVLAAVALAGGAFLLVGRKRAAQGAAFVFVSVLSASAFTHAVKPLVGRARPPLFADEGLWGTKPFDATFDFVSFPSGHATHAGALFTALALLFPRWSPAFAAAALWFGATRIVLGVHYPSDVVTGILLGAGFALAAAWGAARLGFVFRAPPKSGGPSSK